MYVGTYRNCTPLGWMYRFVKSCRMDVGRNPERGVTS